MIPHIPYHCLAQLIDSDTVRVTEMQGDNVIRSYDRDLRTFSRDAQHRIGVAAVTAKGVRL